MKVYLTTFLVYTLVCGSITLISGLLPWYGSLALLLGCISLILTQLTRIIVYPGSLILTTRSMEEQYSKMIEMNLKQILGAYRRENKAQFASFLVPMVEALKKVCIQLSLSLIASSFCGYSQVNYYILHLPFCCTYLNSILPLSN